MTTTAVPVDLSSDDLASEIARLTARLERDRKDYPMNWRFIGEADKERLAACKAERKRRGSR